MRSEVIDWTALRFAQLPPLLASPATAEAFFQFHSFTSRGGDLSDPLARTSPDLRADRGLRRYQLHV
jgi:hypothetical protein